MSHAMLHAAISQPDTISRGVITKLRPRPRNDARADANRVPDRVVLKEQRFSPNFLRYWIARRRRKTTAYAKFFAMPCFRNEWAVGNRRHTHIGSLPRIESLTSDLS